MSPISQNVTQPATGDLTPYLPSTHEKKDDDSDSRSASRIEHAIDESPTVVDAATEKALMRKLDMRLVPMVMWMYLMSFMDRVSIGNARYATGQPHYPMGCTNITHKSLRYGSRPRTHWQSISNRNFGAVHHILSVRGAEQHGSEAAPAQMVSRSINAGLGVSRKKLTLNDTI